MVMFVGTDSGRDGGGVVPETAPHLSREETAASPDCLPKQTAGV